MGSPKPTFCLVGMSIGVLARVAALLFSSLHEPMQKSSGSGSLVVNSLHDIFHGRDILQPFRAEPWSIRPTEAFSEGVVGGNDIPVAIDVWHVNSTLGPVTL